MTRTSNGDDYAKAWTKGYAEGVADMLREGHHTPALKEVATKALKMAGVTVETLRDAGSHAYEIQLLRPYLPPSKPAPVAEPKVAARAEEPLDLAATDEPEDA